jgi:hypothetical protein
MSTTDSDRANNRLTTLPKSDLSQLRSYISANKDKPRLICRIKLPFYPEIIIVI